MDNWKREYKALLETLRTNERFITNIHGQKIRVKDIPDSDKQTGFDPRALDVRVKEEASKAGFNFNGTLQAVRDGMGWPNKDVTEGRVDTKRMDIPGRNGSIPILVYTPVKAGGLRACMLFFHGGGFFGGTVKCVQNPCKSMADNTDIVVVSVDYRLSPENPYPMGLDDCYDALRWVHENAETLGVDKSKLGVAGDSAGGNLAAVCALRDRDDGAGRVRFQGLLYPAVNVGEQPCGDYTWSPDEYEQGEDREYTEISIRSVGESSDTLIKWYLDDDKRHCYEPYASPIRASSLAGVAPALIINAEYDYLRIECEAYARKLEADGVPVELLRYRGLDHAFIDKLGDYPQAEDAMTELGRALLKAAK